MCERERGREREREGEGERAVHGFQRTRCVCVCVCVCKAKMVRKMLPQLDFESVSREVWRCLAQHLEDAAQRGAKVPGRPIIHHLGSFVQFILVSVVMVRVRSAPLYASISTVCIVAFH